MSTKDNYINIHNHKGVDRYVIASKCNMFNSEYLKLIVIDNEIVITIPTIDYNGKMYKTTSAYVGWNQITVVNERLRCGKFAIDEEESTDDELIISLVSNYKEINE